MNKRIINLLVVVALTGWGGYANLALPIVESLELQKEEVSIKVGPAQANVKGLFAFKTASTYVTNNEKGKSAVTLYLPVYVADPKTKSLEKTHAVAIFCGDTKLNLETTSEHPFGEVFSCDQQQPVWFRTRLSQTQMMMSSYKHFKVLDKPAPMLMGMEYTQDLYEVDGQRYFVYLPLIPRQKTTLIKDKNRDYGTITLTPATGYKLELAMPLPEGSVKEKDDSLVVSPTHKKPIIVRLVAK